MEGGAPSIVVVGRTECAAFGDGLRAQHPGLGAVLPPLLISCAQASAGEAGADSRPTTAAVGPPQPQPQLAFGDPTPPDTFRGRDCDPGGIRALVRRLVACFEELTALPPDQQDLLAVTERQRQLLARCRRHLEDFMAEAARGDEATDGEVDIVLAAEHLRHAANALARITGRGEAGDVEEVLGVIFERFVLHRIKSSQGHRQ